MGVTTSCALLYCIGTWQAINQAGNEKQTEMLHVPAMGLLPTKGCVRDRLVTDRCEMSPAPLPHAMSPWPVDAQSSFRGVDEHLPSARELRISASICRARLRCTALWCLGLAIFGCCFLICVWFMAGTVTCWEASLFVKLQGLLWWIYHMPQLHA